MHDAVAVAARDKTAVAVCTKQFESLARGLAEGSAVREVGVIALPFPLDTRPEAEVRRIAVEFLPALFAELGAAP